MAAVARRRRLFRKQQKAVEQTLKRMKKEAPSRAKAIDAVLGSKAMLADLSDDMDAILAKSGQFRQALNEEGKPGFFKWLIQAAWENRAAIWAAIKAILLLFGVAV